MAIPPALGCWIVPARKRVASLGSLIGLLLSIDIAIMWIQWMWISGNDVGAAYMSVPVMFGVLFAGIVGIISLMRRFTWIETMQSDDRGDGEKKRDPGPAT